MENKIEIDFDRYVADDSYAAEINRRYRFETIEQALEQRAMSLQAMGVVLDINADRMDRIAEYYDAKGMTKLAAEKRAKARMAHANARLASA